MTSAAPKSYASEHHPADRGTEGEAALHTTTIEATQSEIESTALTEAALEEPVLTASVLPPETPPKYTIVQVAINRALFKTYDYKILGHYRHEILGSRVKVKFGRSGYPNEIGIVVGLGASAHLPENKIKEGKLLDEISLMEPDVFKTLRFAASYYHYPVGQTMVLGMPKLLREGEPASYKQVVGMRIKLDNVVLPDEADSEAVSGASASDDAAALSADDAATIVAACGNRKGRTKRLSAEEKLARKLKQAQLRLRSKKQKDLLALLAQGPRSVREIRENGFTLAQEQALIKAGLAVRVDLAKAPQECDLEAMAKRSMSLSIEEDPILNSKPLELSAEQAYCLKMITAHYDKPNTTFLLHGITGSGKTEVYLQAIEHCLREGKRALVLVPEISLTPQTFKRFYDRFKVPIATMHSTLSQRERMDAFLDMKNKRAAILIGTRSALFTSIPNLGLIIIDEEHDSSFKQTDTLRYSARTLAAYRANLCGAKLLLGSATPSLESVYHAQMGHYIHLDLLHRANNATLPRLVIEDLSQEPDSPDLRAGFGRHLSSAIGRETARHRQALIFINRRGFSHSLVCSKCHRIVMCPQCDKPLTVHHVTNHMHCHICNAVLPIPRICPTCGAENTLVEIGLGTEQVEAYLKERYPDVSVVRVDRDIITNKTELEITLRRVRSHLYEILVGTQMLSKGHDFPDITVVGIIDVDSGLLSPDFHSLEYTAQLITQVAGRAGRSSEQGEVYIQTYYPDHPLLESICAPNFNYYNLALDLLEIRKAQNLPPYYYQAIIMTNSVDRDLAHDTLVRLIDDIKNRSELTANVELTSVQPDRIERRFNRYHYHVGIMTHHQPSLHRLLDELTQIFGNYTNTRDLRFAIDVDPLYDA